MGGLRRFPNREGFPDTRLLLSDTVNREIFVVKIFSYELLAYEN